MVIVRLGRRLFQGWVGPGYCRVGYGYCKIGMVIVRLGRVIGGLVWVL